MSSCTERRSWTSRRSRSDGAVARLQDHGEPQVGGDARQVGLVGPDDGPERGQFLGVHVAARASAEEDDVAQSAAAARHLDRQRGVVDDRDRRAGERARQIVGDDVGIAEGELERGQRRAPDRLAHHHRKFYAVYHARSA